MFSVCYWFEYVGVGRVDALVIVGLCFCSVSILVGKYFVVCVVCMMPIVVFLFVGGKLSLSVSTCWVYRHHIACAAGTV